MGGVWWLYACCEPDILPYLTHQQHGYLATRSALEEKEGVGWGRVCVWRPLRSTTGGASDPEIRQGDRQHEAHRHGQFLKFDMRY